MIMMLLSQICNCALNTTWCANICKGLGLFVFLTQGVDNTLPSYSTTVVLFFLLAVNSSSTISSSHQSCFIILIHVIAHIRLLLFCGYAVCSYTSPAITALFFKKKKIRTGLQLTYISHTFLCSTCLYTLYLYSLT